MSSPATGPVLGPCSTWVTGEDVAACCAGFDGSDASLLDSVAVEASMVLFELSGRQFPDECERTVRPCADACGCFARSPAAGYSPWSWAGEGWANECGDRCGCSALSRVKLAGYPVRGIVTVKIDGDVVPASEYRLDGWRWLVRVSDPGPPVERRSWPGCQDLALPDTEDGTFSITYTWGVAPPQLGRDAAAQLACELYKSCGGGECKLPSGATRVTRQGVTVDRAALLSWLEPKKSTGLSLVDTFLAAYWVGARAGRRAAVFSPDVTPYPRREGV